MLRTSLYAGVNTCTPMVRLCTGVHLFTCMLHCFFCHPVLAYREYVLACLVMQRAVLSKPMQHHAATTSCNVARCIAMACSRSLGRSVDCYVCMHACRCMLVRQRNMYMCRFTYMYLHVFLHILKHNPTWPVNRTRNR